MARIEQSRNLKRGDATYFSKNPLIRYYFWSRLSSMMKVARGYDGKLLVDLGCGGGELLTMLGGKFPESEYLGIDTSEEIHSVKREAMAKQLHGIHFVRADCRFLPLKSGCSQLIFCASVLEHLPKVQPAAFEISRVLQLGGRFIAGIPTENLLYRIARGITGLRKPADHYHRGVRIQEILERSFTRIGLRILPFSSLPRSLGLYLVLVFIKHE
jgi:SAM-dependent methyltransferase